MLLSYIYNILKFKKWEILSLLAMLLALKWFTIFTFQPNIRGSIELHKCPACFGTSACSYIHEVDIALRDVYSVFAYFFGVKNVFFGVFNNGSRVIVKKLAQNSELEEFDRTICEDEAFSDVCEKSIVERTDYKINANFRELVEKEIATNTVRNKLNGLKLCPTVQRLNALLNDVYNNERHTDRKILDVYIWVLTILNAEPLVLQILPADKGWPVPKYFGACGRIVVEEYVGLPLTAYYNEPWLRRAKLASSLLDAAYKFTYKNENFSFYLTDVSADNVAVDSADNVKFVDLESIIVVDKSTTPTEKSTTWSQLQVNTEDFSCPECLAFSSTDICNHRVSDHNYYAICKVLLTLNVNNGILPGGLLHDMPADIFERYPAVRHLIQQCVHPQTPVNRIDAGIELKKLLDVIVQRRDKSIE